jgi:haloalkane dehalogenase
MTSAVVDIARGAHAARRAAVASEYPFASHFVDVDGGRMHYVDEGERDAPPLLCLHGNPTWSFYFRRLVRAFSSDHRVVALDHIGCGLSDKPQRWTYTLAAHAENVERLVLALDLRDITLVVHDWGGAIGMGFARRRPERVARLVILNTAAFLGRVPWRIRLCRAPFLGELLVRRWNAFAGLAPRMALAHPSKLDRAARDGLLLPYRSFEDRVAIQRFVEDIPTSPRHRSFAELAAIDASLAQFRDRPACIVWGERDWCFDASFLGEWRARFPEAEVHALPDTGHYLLEESPREVEAALRWFFARHPIHSGNTIEAGIGRDAEAT